MVDSAIAKRWRKLSGNVFRAPMRGASERQIDRAGAVWAAPGGVCDYRRIGRVHLDRAANRSCRRDAPDL